MSKAKKKAHDNRRIRRILNSAGDTLVGRITRKLYRAFYGDGITKNSIVPKVRK